MRQRSIAFLALLWRFIVWIFSFLIVGTIVGVVGSIVYTYITTGSISFANPGTLSITQFLRSHPYHFASMLIVILALAICSYLASRSQKKRPRTDIIPSATPLLSRQEQQNRQRMIAKVRALWITGVLEQSLHGVAIIKLGLNEQLNAIVNPWNLVVQELNQPVRTLPPGTSITRVFDEAGGELLILGESGSGKTTLLLELARDLLDRATRNDTLQIPVVFNLSIWALKKQPLGHWLIDELHSKYQVPRAIGEDWIERNQILPLLDGFDELGAKYRNACVKAINDFRQGEHGLVPMVVCSRLAIYQAQRKQIQLRNVVTIQGLTAEQIDEYISSAERQLAPLRVAMREDPILQELATTPLMLSVLMLTYQGRPVEELVQPHSLESLRKEVFSRFVQQMLTRRRINPHYTFVNSKHWLTWMAQQIRQHSQTVFYIEQMQPDWLPEGRLRRIYQYLAIVIPGILIGGLVGFLASEISFSWSFITQMYMLVGMLVGGLICAGKISTAPAEQRTGTRQNNQLKNILIRNLNDRLFVGLGLGIIAGVAVGLEFGLGYGLAICLCSVLLNDILWAKRSSEYAQSDSQVVMEKLLA